MRTGTRFVGVACAVVLGMGLSAGRAGAGVIAGTALEFKGVFQPTVPTVVFTSRMYIKLVSGWGARDGEEHTRLNGERVINIPVGPPVLVYNLYPVIIHVPQPLGLADPTAPIDFYSVMLADQGNGIGGLPTGWAMTEASLVDGSGNVHEATITPLGSLANLPTSSANDTQIVWDLTEVPNQTGNFYLARYTMTGAQVPEPAGLAVVLAGVGALSLVRSRRTCGS